MGTQFLSPCGAREPTFERPCFPCYLPRAAGMVSSRPSATGSDVVCHAPLPQTLLAVTERHPVPSYSYMPSPMTPIYTVSVSSYCWRTLAPRREWSAYYPAMSNVVHPCFSLSFHAYDLSFSSPLGASDGPPPLRSMRIAMLFPTVQRPVHPFPFALFDGLSLPWLPTLLPVPMSVVRSPLYSSFSTPYWA